MCVVCLDWATCQPSILSRMTSLTCSRHIQAGKERFQENVGTLGGSFRDSIFLEVKWKSCLQQEKFSSAHIENYHKSLMAFLSIYAISERNKFTSLCGTAFKKVLVKVGGRQKLGVGGEEYIYN